MPGGCESTPLFFIILLHEEIIHIVLFFALLFAVITVAKCPHDHSRTGHHCRSG